MRRKPLHVSQPMFSALFLLSACVASGKLGVVDSGGTAVQSGTPSGTVSSGVGTGTGTGTGSTTGFPSTGTPTTGVPDGDGDGWDAAGDCDDTDPQIHPGADEIGWNGVDEDCDGLDGRLPQVGAGGVHSCRLDNLGALACWGDDSSGQSPAALVGPYRELSVGYTHTCVIDAASQVQCWGDDASGQATPPGGAFERIAAGYTHAYGIDTAGEIQCWGDVDGVIPTGTFVEIAAGWHQTCALDVAGTPTCWGSWGGGVEAPPAGPLTGLGEGFRHMCGVGGGGVDCWADLGLNGRGADRGGVFIDVAGGDDHTCALDVQGVPECWGADSWGGASPPALVGAVRIAAGGGHTCVVDAAGVPTCWGLDSMGQAAP